MGRRENTDRADVVVVGCGVIGLTTAIKLQESGFAVEIWTAALPKETTSIVAGATWFPYKAYPLDRVLEWAEKSKPVFEKMAEDPRTGVMVRECLQLWREPVDDEPWWASVVPDLRRYPEDQLPYGFRDSYFFTQPVIETPIYLDYLVNRFEEGGGSIRQTVVRSLEEPTQVAGTVINCTGLEAKNLVGDTELVPVRGQWVRVRNPGIEKCISDLAHPDGFAYIIPRSDDCILGGTEDEWAWDTTPSMEVAAAILARCVELDRRLADAPVLEHRAGLRPVRPSGVRLESENMANGSVCIHNYGHGGAGVTLSWGCALEVENLLNQALAQS